MSNKIVFILGSSRGDGETRAMVDEARTLVDADFIDLNDYRIEYYDYEYRNRDDDFYPLIERLTNDYDTLVFATPIYWYSMAAVMKTFFDRISDLIRIYKDTGRKLRGKRMALMSCASEAKMIEEFPMPFKRSADYLGMTFLGNVHGYLENGQLPHEVKQDIREFVDLIQKT